MLFFGELFAFSSKADRFIPVAFLCATADCSEVDSTGISCPDVVECVAIESGGGEVSSGKVVLHIVVLEKKKFSLAGRSSKYRKVPLFVHAQKFSALVQRW